LAIINGKQWLKVTKNDNQKLSGLFQTDRRDAIMITREELEEFIEGCI